MCECTACPTHLMPNTITWAEEIAAEGVRAATAGIAVFDGGVWRRARIYCSDLSTSGNRFLVLSQGQSYANVIPHSTSKTQLEPRGPLISSKKESCASLHEKIQGGHFPWFFSCSCESYSIHTHTMFFCSSLSIWSWIFLKTCPDTARIQFIEAILKAVWVKVRLERGLQ